MINKTNYFSNNKVKENLDFDFVLSKLQVETPYGLECKAKMVPFPPGEEEQLTEELEKIEKFLHLMKQQRATFIHIKSIFSHIKDLRNSLSRCGEGYTLTVVELFEIKNFIMFLRDMENDLKSLHWKLPEDISVKGIPKLVELLDPQKTGVKTFYIYDDYSEELQNIRKAKKLKDKKIKEAYKKIREDIKEDLGIHMKSNGDVMVSKSDHDLIKKIEASPLLVYNSETYMNIKYAIKSTKDLSSLEKELEDLKDKEEKEEFNIRTRLSQHIASFSDEITRNMKAIGRLDLTIGKAYMALRISGVKPDITGDHRIHILEGRHLKVEEALKSEGEKFVPITVDIRTGVTCITGANMGGKTVTLKLVGLLSAMAQYGLFVPCTKMTTGLHGYIHISVGDLQSADMGLSTFGGEIKGIQEAIERKEARGLILIDELARGTNPEEGYAISKAIVNYLNKQGHITMITTHYDHVANTEGIIHLQVIGLSHVDYNKLKEELHNNKDYGIDTLRHHMDYRLVRVTNKKQVPRDAINVAKLMGLKEDILKEAEWILETEK